MGEIEGEEEGEKEAKCKQFGYRAHGNYTIIKTFLYSLKLYINKINQD